MTTTRERRFQFSVRSLLLALACCSLVFAVLPVLGVVAGSTAAMMLAVYLVIRARPLRKPLSVVTIIGFLIVMPVIDDALPAATDGIYEPFALVIGAAAKSAASIAYFPIELASFSDEWWWYSRYHDLPRFIRTEVVAAFWLQMMAAVVLAIVASQIRLRWARRNSECGAQLIVPERPSDVRSEAA